MVSIDALWSGFAGTVIGSLTSIGTLAVQSTFQNRREQKRLVVETAFKDYELRFRNQDPNTPGFFPFPVMLAYHEKMIELIEDGRFSSSAAKEIVSAMGEMRDALAAEGQKFDRKTEKTGKEKP